MLSVLKVYENPVDSVRSIFHAALLIDAPMKESYSFSNINVAIALSSFTDNERGLVLKGAIGAASLADCLFQDNIAMHIGAGLLIEVADYTTPVSIDRCVFNRNHAGQFRQTMVSKYEDQFRVKGDEVSVNTVLCEQRAALF